MIALRKTKAERGLELVEPAEPLPGPGEVLIAVAAAGICGSDLHADRWTDSYAFMTEHLPVTLGHEFAGRVMALGDCVRDFAIGDRVTAWPSVTCGRCRACRRQEPHDCEAKSIIGLHRNGAF